MDYSIDSLLAPFNERKVCRLTLHNISQRRIGFKMRCTAAEYYAANPASGIIEPNDSYIISGNIVSRIINELAFDI